MHAVLQNRDLLTNICEIFLDPYEWKAKPALLSLALVCRDISCIAVSLLWRDIDLRVLYFTFPEDIVFTGEDGRKSWNLTPITPEQWSRFDICARYIRHIVVTAFKKDSEIDGLFDALGRYPHSQNRFPHLKRLTLHIDTPRFRDAAILLCPTLTDVTISLGGTDTKGHRDVADFLQALGGKSMCLQKFSYSDDDEIMARPAIFFDSLTYLIYHSTRLQTAGVPLSRNTLVALAQLPSLTHLDLDCFDPLLATQTQEIGISHDEQLDEQVTFVSLEKLDLSLEYPWPSSNLLKGLFRGLRVRRYSTWSSFLTRRRNGTSRNWPLSLKICSADAKNLGTEVLSWRKFLWIAMMTMIWGALWHGDPLIGYWPFRISSTYDFTVSFSTQPTWIWKKLRKCGGTCIPFISRPTRTTNLRATIHGSHFLGSHICQSFRRCDTYL